MNPESSNSSSDSSLLKRNAEALRPSNPADVSDLIERLHRPLATILSSLDGLARQPRVQQTPICHAYLQQIRSSVAELNKQINRVQIEQTIAAPPRPEDSNNGNSDAAPGLLPVPQALSSGSILVVDDNATTREILKDLLQHLGFKVATAETGEQGLWMFQSKSYDLMLLDLILPGMSGFDVLGFIKKDIDLRHLPVVMLSGVDQTDSVVKCIEMGAEDFLMKPFNPTLLRARIYASLEKKLLRDMEQSYYLKLQAEQEKSERLLLNILPKPIADRLKRGESTIVDAFPEVTVLFADLAGFTGLSTTLSPADLVGWLNEVFSEFDALAEQHGLEKIKTIGDAYMAVGGLPTPRKDHAFCAANMALDMQSAISRINARNKSALRIRVGLHSGPVIAGIIGTKKFIYDLWGDTVNTASRMESHGHPGHIQVTEATYQLVKDQFFMVRRGSVEVKGKGHMTTYLLLERKTSEGFAEADAPASLPLTG